MSGYACSQIFFKDGSSAFKLHCCRTASCDLFFVVRWLKPMIHNKHRILLSKQVLLLPIMHVHILWHLSMKQSGSWSLNSSHTPGTVQTQLHLTITFGPVQEALHGWKYVSDNIVKDMVHMWLWSHLKISFTDGIRRIVNHHKICVEKRGDYIQKWYTAFVTECCTWSN